MDACRWPVILRFWVGGATVLVNGHRQAFVRSSGHEAPSATGLVSGVCGFGVPVGALIVMVRAEEVVITQ